MLRRVLCQNQRLLQRICHKTEKRSGEIDLFSTECKTDHTKSDQHIQHNNRNLTNIVNKDAIIIPNFVNEEEEKILLKIIEPKWRRLKYQKAHWDHAIHDYRETEVSKWPDECQNIIQRIQNASFNENDIVKKAVHVLDLNEDGFIKPHVDAIKFCGRVIAGISLLSSSVMRLIHENDPTLVVNLLLERRSLYIIRNELRYKYTHEILKNEESYFMDEHIPKGRRISVICRSEPLVPMDPNSFQTKVVQLD